jgi:hypothetical protein
LVIRPWNILEGWTASDPTNDALVEGFVVVASTIENLCKNCKRRGW